MNFEIKFGVAPKSTSGRKSKYPFKSMTPNTYFDVPASHPSARSTKNNPSAIQSAAHSYGRRNNKKFKTMRLDDNSIRVWCVS